MNSKIEQVTVIDSNALATGIMQDIAHVEQMERMLETDLTSEELFRIDCAILSSLRSTKDFSRDLLHQLETNTFENFVSKPQKSEASEFKEIQQGAIMDITLPLQQMLVQMAGYVEDAFSEQ